MRTVERMAPTMFNRNRDYLEKVVMSRFVRT